MTAQSPMEKVGTLFNNYAMFGLRRTLQDVLVHLLAVTAKPVDRFDARYGVSTSGTAEPAQGSIEDQDAEDSAHGYDPIRESVMLHILSSVKERLDPREFSFVDLGSGKGRALLLASRLPFQQVVGIELSPLHTRLAQENISAYLSQQARRGRAGKSIVRCANIQATCQDATHADLPRTNLLIYMYNPFSAPVMRRVLDRIADFQAQTRLRVLILLVFPASEPLLEAHPAYRKIGEFQVISRVNSWNLWECEGALRS